MIDECHKQTKADKAAWSQDEEQHTVSATDKVDTEETAGTKSLADYAKQGEGPREAQTDKETVKERVPHIVL